MKRLKKIEYVKRWLLSGKTLTQLQCASLFNYYRLADAIFVLKKRGYEIENLNKKPNYAKYKLKQNERTV